MKRTLLVLLGCLLISTAMAADTELTPPFSDSAPGSALPAGWKPYAMSRKKPPAPLTLVRDGQTTVLHIDANQSAGGIAHALNLPADSILNWRWKVDHVVAKANLAQKSGDDFAARVYVMFDVPKSALSFGQRIKLSIASHVMGEPLPRAALCYVWDNTHKIGTIAPNAYYGAVKTIVLQSGNGKAGHWQLQRRNVAADFQAAFGRPAPKVIAVALASDTDNTGGHAQAWFGNLSFTPARPVADPKETSR